MTSSNVFIHSNSEYSSFLNFSLFAYVDEYMCVYICVFFTCCQNLFIQNKSYDVWDLEFNLELSSGVWEVIIRAYRQRGIGYGW